MVALLAGVAVAPLVVAVVVHVLIDVQRRPGPGKPGQQGRAQEDALRLPLRGGSGRRGRARTYGRAQGGRERDDLLFYVQVHVFLRARTPRRRSTARVRASSGRSNHPRVAYASNAWSKSPQTVTSG